MPALIYGYGLVSAWAVVDPVDLCTRAREAGLTCTQIEIQGGQGEPVEFIRDPFNPDDVQPILDYVAAARDQNLITLITMSNWNGVATREQTNEWFTQWCLVVRDQVGCDRIFAEPISEPSNGDPKAQAWQAIALATLPPVVLVGNGDSGRGDSLIPVTFTDWHWCEIWDEGNVLLPPFINNTDCGGVLNPGPSLVGSMSLAALAHDAHVIFYDNQATEVDQSALDAMRESLGGETLDLVPTCLGGGRFAGMVV